MTPRGFVAPSLRLFRRRSSELCRTQPGLSYYALSNYPAFARGYGGQDAWQAGRTETNESYVAKLAQADAP